MSIFQRFYIGMRLRDVYPHATRWQIIKFRFWRLVGQTIIGGTGLATASGMYFAGATFSPQQVLSYQMKEVVVEVAADAPVMARIRDCESGKRDKNGKGIPGSASHYGPSGQVLMTPNTNGTVDVGISAINTVWFKKASELGLDVTKEADNIKMGEWIYANRGTEDWYPSKSCWSK